MLDAATLVAVVAIVLVASVVQSTTGFGLALLAVPVLAATIGAKEAVVLANAMGVVSSGAIAVRYRSQADWPVASRLLLGSLAGMPIGLAVILVVDDQVLLGMIAVVVLVMVALLVSGWTLPPRGTRLDVGVGFVSGLLRTSTATAGPPVVLLLQARSEPPGPFRATTSVVLGVGAVVGLVLLALGGQFNATVAWSALVALPALLAGWWIGDRLHRRVPAERFRVAVLVLLVATAGTALVEAVRG